MLDISVKHAFALLLLDLGFPKIERDYLNKRVSCEGLPFMTQTLPNFFKWILAQIERSCYEYGGPKGTPSPFDLRSAWLRRWRFQLNRLNTGEALDASFLLQMSTVCGYFYKLALPMSEDQEAAATKKYVEIQQAMEYGHVPTLDESFVDRVRKTIETDYGLQKLSLADIVAKVKEGPGSVINNDRLGISISARRYKDSLDGQYPTWGKAFSGAFRYRRTTIYSATKTSLPDTVPTEYGKPFRLKPMRTSANPDVCQVVFVPKDARGPRVISKETHATAKVSLGFHYTLREHLQNASRGKIQFTDQTIFKALAKSSSLDGKFSTLDLSDASDRHSIHLARRLYRNIPVVRFALNHLRPTSYCIRSRKGTIKGTLGSVAGMGNGLTFPLMALTIHATIVTAARLHGYHEQAKHVFVYGDDIIVPTEISELATRYLEKMLFKVNVLKTFRLGKFRESCGGDYYNGVAITPIRLKQTFCDQIVTKTMVLKPDSQSKDVHNADKFVYKLERHCRLLVENGYTRLAEFYYKAIDEFLGKMGVALGRTNDMTDQRLCRYRPFDTHASTWDQPAAVYRPVYDTGDFNRLIRGRLGTERSQDKFRSWLRGERGCPFFTTRAISRDANSFQLNDMGPLMDARRYAGKLVKV